MEYVRKVAEEIIRDGLITREFAEQQIVELQNQITKDNSQSQKQGDTSRLFLMNLFKQGKLTITQLPQYAEKLQLMDNKPSATTPQPQPPPPAQHPPPMSAQMSVVSQSDPRSIIKSPPKLRKKFSLRAMASFTSMGSFECPPEYPGSSRTDLPTSPGTKRRSKQKSEPATIRNISRAQSRFFDPIPQPFGSNQATSQSNPIFKVYELQKDDGQRKMLVFVFSANVVQYIVRGKKPIEIPFDEISHHDVSEGQIIITTTTEQTYQLGLSDVSEQDKVRKCLSSIGHEDDLCLVEENVLIEGYLDKKGPHALGGTKKRFVKVTQGKLSYYKMDSSKSYEAPLNTIVLNPELNEIKRFGNDGFTIVPKIKDEKDFSFMIQKGKLKVDDIIEKREQWVAAIKQAYEVGAFSSPTHPSVHRAGSTIKPVGTHLVNLAKQQLESMLVVLKEYEAEDECAAQASKMYQLLDDIERKLMQNLAAASNVAMAPPIQNYPSLKFNKVSPSTDDISSQSSTTSNREESLSSAYEDIDIQVRTPSYERTTIPLHYTDSPVTARKPPLMKQQEVSGPPPDRIPPPVPPHESVPADLEDDEECPYDTLDAVGPRETQDDEPIYDSVPTRRDDTDKKPGEPVKKPGEPVYETIPSKPTDPEEETGTEDPVYDAVPVKTTDRKISTEVDGFFNQFPASIRTRTHAYSMARPKAADTPIRQRKESYEMVDIKHAKLSTDTNTSPEKPVKYTVVHREDVLEEDDEIYNVPSLVKPADDLEEAYSDIYYAPSLQKPEPPGPEPPGPKPPGPKPPTRPVPQLPGHPTRPPPPLPPPIKPPRPDLHPMDDEYVVQDPDEKLVSNVSRVPRVPPRVFPTNGVQMYRPREPPPVPRKRSSLKREAKHQVQTSSSAVTSPQLSSPRAQLHRASVGSASVGSSERSEYSDQYVNNLSPQPFFPPPPPPRRDSNPNIGLPPRAPPQNNYHGNDDSGQMFVFDDRINQLPMSPPRMGTLDNKNMDGFRNERTPTNAALISHIDSKSVAQNDHIDSNRKNDCESGFVDDVYMYAGGDEDDENMYADADEYCRNRSVIEAKPPPPTKVPPPKPPTRTYSKTLKIDPVKTPVIEDPALDVPDPKPENSQDALPSPPPATPDLPAPPPELPEEPLYEETELLPPPVKQDEPAKPVEPVKPDLPVKTAKTEEKENQKSNEQKESEPKEDPDHIYSDTYVTAVEPPKPVEPPKVDPPKPAAPVVPKPPVTFAPPPAPVCTPKPPGAPRPPGVPRPPSASIVARAGAKYQPQIVPKVKVLPLHWQKVPPISFKKSVWGELVDVSPSIDVIKLEEYFATKQAVKEITKPTKTQEKQNYLDSKRSQNIGIFLHGTSIQPDTIGDLVARIKNGENMENITSLKKFSPTAEDIKVFCKIPESSVSSLDKADKLMWYMVNTPYFTQRLNIIEVTISIPDDIEDIKRMVDNILEVCRVLLNSNSFLRFLEKILTIGNMMNAAIKKTSPGFKLSSTLPKLSTIKSQDKTVSLLDFIVQQAVLLDGDCLKFVNDLQIVHSASNSSSIVALSAEVDIMKQDMNKLSGRANDISQKCPSDNHVRKELELFVDDVRSFVKFFQQNVFLLNEQSAQMKSDYSKVLERFGESPNTDSEEFMKMLSEFQTSLVDSIKRCPHPLPQCVAHLKPKPLSNPAINKPKMAQMDLASSLKNSSLFKRSTQSDLKIPT